MNQFEIWVYRGLIGLLLILVWYFIKAGFSGIREDIRELIAEIKHISNENATFNEKFAVVNHRFTDVFERLNHADDKIRHLELDQAACKNKNTD